MESPFKVIIEELTSEELPPGSGTPDQILKWMDWHQRLAEKLTEANRQKLLERLGEKMHLPVTARLIKLLSESGMYNDVNFTFFLGYVKSVLAEAKASGTGHVDDPWYKIILAEHESFCTGSLETILDAIVAALPKSF